ncbi:MAG: asparagine synthase, partial [Thioalkalivibrio sp.]|nr:asparagine synthase [Thioalkalivibrio sp.]
MAGFCGWFGLRSGSPAEGLEAQGAALPDPLTNQSSDQLEGRLGGCLVRGGWIAENQERIAAIAGHPQWRDAALAQRAREQGPAEALLEAWQRDGDGLLERIGGDFALAVIDAAQGRLLAAIDRLGQMPLHFARVDGGLVFGTTAGSVVAHPAVSTSITDTGLYHYCFFHMLPAPTSLFAGVEKLRGAHRLVHQGGHTQVGCYWLPRFEESAAASVAAHAEALQEHLETAVRRSVDSAHTGAFLSGGLDSSTVAGMLARMQPGD